MAVELEGGCRVTNMNEGPPQVDGSMKLWKQIGRANGAQAISLRVYEFDSGLSPKLHNLASDEVFYVLTSNESLKVLIDDRTFGVSDETGIYLRPGQTFQVNNEGDSVVTLVSSQCPEELDQKTTDDTTSPQSLVVRPIVRLVDRRAQPTADRWYRVLVDESVGSEQVTQFVGSIPPGRAPDHFHHYEEVLFILRGQGRMWAGVTNTRIGPGSCVYLPKGQVHCVENTGTSELRLLGLFYPAGSPAVRYDA